MQTTDPIDITNNETIDISNNETIDLSNNSTLITETLSNTDKLTLELLMNKTHYKKYIAKHDPTKLLEQQEQNTDLIKYKYDIIKLTTQLIDDPEMQINSSINDLFCEYSKTLINYFKHKEVEMLNQYNHNDDDTIFENIDYSPSTKSNVKSYWGKTIIFKK
jgi:hypothetical protein